VHQMNIIPSIIRHSTTTTTTTTTTTNTTALYRLIVNI